MRLATLSLAVASWACSAWVDDALAPRARTGLDATPADQGPPDAEPPPASDAAADPDARPDGAPADVDGCAADCARLLPCLDAEACPGLVSEGAPFWAGRCEALCAGAPDGLGLPDAESCLTTRAAADPTVVARLCPALTPCHDLCADRGQGRPLVECGGAPADLDEAGCVARCRQTRTSGDWRCVGAASLPGFADDPNEVICEALRDCLR